jgi:hypothetical protein
LTASISAAVTASVAISAAFTSPSAIAEGQRIHYNFVKPHQALDGRTSAETSGIKIEGKNEWLTLLKNPNSKTKGCGEIIR